MGAPESGAEEHALMPAWQWTSMLPSPASSAARMTSTALGRCVSRSARSSSSTGMMWATTSCSEGGAGSVSVKARRGEGKGARRTDRRQVDRPAHDAHDVPDAVRSEERGVSRSDDVADPEPRLYFVHVRQPAVEGGGGSVERQAGGSGGELVLERAAAAAGGGGGIGRGRGRRRCGLGRR